MKTQQVRQFTQESMGINLPRHPIPMTREEVVFLTRMVCEELMEMLSTITDSEESVKILLSSIVDKSLPPVNYVKPTDEVGIVAEQADAMVDIMYYSYNAAVKKGYDLDELFDVVHAANMNKRFPDGTFHRNDSGKVIKPDGWVEPDVKKVVREWMDN